MRATSRPTLFVATTLVAGSLAVGFAPAPPPAAASPTTLSVPEVRIEVGDDAPVRTVGGMVDRMGLAPGESLRDPVAREARVRRLLDVQGHATVRATDAACPDCEGGDHDDEGEAPVGAYSGSFATADLDGDGTDDVLVLHEVYDEEGVVGSVEARSGADGSLLWQRDEPGYFAAVPDLDGDGLPDLIAGTAVWGMSDGPPACVDPLDVTCDGWVFRFDEALTLTAFSGAAGTQLASVELTSSYEETYRSTALGVAGRDEVEVTMQDMMFGLGFIDVDGDGAHELVHDRNDGTYRHDGAAGSAFVAGFFAGTVAEDLTGEVVAVDFASGEVTELRTDDGAVLLVDAVDLGAGPRLLLDRFPEYGEATLACADSALESHCFFARDASGGTPPVVPTRALHDADVTPVWEVPLAPTSWFAMAVGGDLDGDGVADLVDLRSDDESWDDLITAVSGATGADIWTARTTIAAMSGGELVAASGHFDGDADREEVEVRAQRLDPATGQVLAETTVASAGADVPDDEDVFVWGSLGLGLLPLDGDDVLDVLGEVDVQVFTFGEEDCEPSEDPEGGEDCWWGPGEMLASAYELAAVDGRDLQRLLHRTDPAGWLFGVADLDGDAAAELIMVTDDGVVAERLDGSLLWSLPRDTGYGGLLSTPIGHDVVVDEPGRTTVRAGADLSLRWAVPA